MKTETIHIFGHKNPDTDSICAAIAYADFQESIGNNHYVPARCGSTNARIDAVLEHFKRPAPKFLGDIQPRVKDIMAAQPKKALTHFTCAEALEIMDMHDLRALPVVDKENVIQGMVTIFSLGEFYIPKTQEPSEMRHVHASSIDAVIRTLKAEAPHVVNGDKIQDLYVRVGAMDIDTFGKFTRDKAISPDTSVVVVGDRRDIQERSIDHKVRLLVISGNSKIDPDMLEKAKQNDVSIVLSKYDAATTTWMIKAASMMEPMVEKEVVIVAEDDLLTDIRKKIAQHPSAPLYLVSDSNHTLKGCFTKTDLLRYKPPQIALVDHNEITQAVDGAEEAEIVEVIDHHRLGNSPTKQPILFHNQPVGSTCTIIAQMFRQRGLTPESSTAGLMMGGIISDTLHLQSPTTTDIDKDILSWLSEIAKIKSEDLAETMFNAGSVILSAKPQDVITSDCKLYQENNVRLSVSQVEELGFDNFWQHADALYDALEDYRNSEDLFMSCLLVTDINTQNSLLVVTGSKAFIEGISYPQLEPGKIFDFPKIVSRKKQLIPYITEVLKSI